MEDSRWEQANRNLQGSRVSKDEGTLTAKPWRWRFTMDLPMIYGDVPKKMAILPYQGSASSRRLVTTVDGIIASVTAWEGGNRWSSFSKGTPWIFNIASEKLPSQKESSLPTIVLYWLVNTFHYIGWLIGILMSWFMK